MPIIFFFLLIYLLSLFMSTYIKDSDISFIFNIISIIIGCIPIVLITFIICFDYGIISGIFIGLLLLLLLLLTNKIIKFIFKKFKTKNTIKYVLLTIVYFKYPLPEYRDSDK